MSRQFTVKLRRQPGALAELLEALAARGIDFRAVSVSGIGRQSTVVLMSNNDLATHHVLRAHGYTFAESDVIITSVADEPGALAALFRHLTECGICLQGVLLLRWHQGKAELALSAENPVHLRHLIAEYTRFAA